MAYTFNMKRGFLMDIIDIKILDILSQNSKLTNKEIGEIIHMTGQAVGNRILKLQQRGIIQRFSVVINYPYTQYIRFFMDSNKYVEFETHVNTYPDVISIQKVSGQACYMIVSHFTELNLSKFIEEISKWRRYSVETVISDKTK